MTIEEILQNVSGSSKYRDIYDKILSTDSLMSTMVMNQIQKENPKSPSDLWPILDRIRGEYRSILGGGPSTDHPGTDAVRNPSQFKISGEYDSYLRYLQRR